MRKIIVSEMVTVDGFFAGPKGEIDWHNVDDEFNQYAIEMLNSVDTFLFGRVTYELMASYWPTAGALKDDPIVAERMNSLAKVVFSKTLHKVDWQNSQLVSENIVDAVAKLKQQPGKDMAIFGSGTIVSLLTAQHLIDEYRFMVNPVILGKGKTLFAGLEQTFKLQLEEAKSFRSGNVLLKYQPI